MKIAPAIALVPLLLGMATCQRPVVSVSPAPGPAAVQEHALREARASKAAAAVQAANTANEQNAPGNAKEATAGELSVARVNLPEPSVEDAAEAQARVLTALRGDLDTARKEWDRAKADSDRLATRLAEAEKRAEDERASSARAIEAMKADYERQIQKAKNEAERQLHRTINLVFIVGGALVCVAGALSICGMFTRFAALPIVGPRFGGCVIAAGVCMIAAGQVLKWVLDHLLISFLILAIPLVAAGAFYVANRAGRSGGGP